MIKLGRTLLTIATELWTDGSDEYRQYVSDCTALVREILQFDIDNREGIELMHDLYRLFKVELRSGHVPGTKAG